MCKEAQRESPCHHSVSAPTTPCSDTSTKQPSAPSRGAGAGKGRLLGCQQCEPGAGGSEPVAGTASRAAHS